MSIRDVRPSLSNVLAIATVLASLWLVQSWARRLLKSLLQFKVRKRNDAQTFSSTAAKTVLDNISFLFANDLLGRVVEL